MRTKDYNFNGIYSQRLLMLLLLSLLFSVNHILICNIKL